MPRCAKPGSTPLFIPAAGAATMKFFRGRSLIPVSLESSCSVKTSARTKPAQPLRVLPSTNARAAEYVRQPGSQMRPRLWSNCRDTPSRLNLPRCPPSLFNCEKSRASRGVIKIVVVGEARTIDGASKLHAYFYPAVFQLGRDNRVIGHVKFGRTLLKLITHPCSLIALRNRHVNFVLHHVSKIIGIHRDRDIKIARVNHDREDRYGDHKLQTRSAPFVLTR